MSDQRPTARFIKPGEMLAMDPKYILRDAETGAFFWMFRDPGKASERKGDIAIVHVRGELEHHKGWGESYEGIRERIDEAITGEDCVKAHERAHKWDDDYEPMTARPPKRIIVCIDSPGGVVAGLNECVRSLRKTVKAHPEIAFEVYVNEMAASAAYALACAFPKISAPPDSAIIGSIGVISTMISQARKNEKDGYDVELITSGARKADGHVHAPITPAAVAAERRRVDQLAAAFWALASKARRIPVERIKGFQAGIYLSKDALRRKLIDSIVSWDVLLGSQAGDTVNGTNLDRAGGNKTDRRETEPSMSIAALIKKTKASIAKEKDPEKLATLYANLAAYKKTEKHVEHVKTEEGADDEDDDEDGPPSKKDEEDDDEGDEEDAKAEEDEKAKAAAKKDEEEESEEEEAKAALAAIRSATGFRGKAARGALAALAALPSTLARDVEALKKQTAADKKASLIGAALAAKQITRAEAKDLRASDLPFVEGWLAMRKKAGFVVTDEDALAKPKHVQPGTVEALPEATRAQIDAAVAAYPLADKKAYRETLEAAHLRAHNDQIKAAGGAPGRY